MDAKNTKHETLVDRVTSTVAELVDEALQAMEVVNILTGNESYELAAEWRTRASSYRHALALLAGVSPDDVVVEREVTDAGLKAIRDAERMGGSRNTIDLKPQGMYDPLSIDKVAQAFRSAGYRLMNPRGEEVERGTYDECLVWIHRNTPLSWLRALDIEGYRIEVL